MDIAHGKKSQTSLPFPLQDSTLWARVYRKDHFGETIGSALQNPVGGRICPRLPSKKMGTTKGDLHLGGFAGDSGGPVGVETLAATVGEQRSTIEDVYEPYLMFKGLLMRGPRGRQLSAKGLEHLKAYSMQG